MRYDPRPLYILAILLILLLMMRLVAVRMFAQKFPDDSTIAACHESARLTQPAFKGTEWEGYDFYTNCLNEIYYANPMNRERPYDKN